MGIFKKMKESLAGTDAGSIENARLGRAIITDLSISGTSITTGGVETRVCTFALEVALDDTPRYMAQARQRIAVWDIGRIQPGNTTVAVRVDATDPQRVAIDWETPPPQVRAGADANTGSAAAILATGEACQVVIVQYQDMGMNGPTGDPIYAFVLTVIPTGAQPYQIQVGNPVPARALPKLFPGSQVPAKRIPSDAQSVVIDWDAALTAA
jgi:hypothetical protein